MREHKKNIDFNRGIIFIEKTKKKVVFLSRSKKELKR